MKNHSSFVILILLITLLFSACQESLPTSPASQETLSALTPTHPSNNKPQPTATPTQPAPTATLSPYLLVTPEALNGIHIRFWHPWNTKTALQLVTLVDEFNRNNSWGIFVEAREMSSATQLFDALQTEWQNPQTRPHLIAASSDQLLALQAKDPQNPLLVNLNDYLNAPEAGMTQQEILDFPLVFWEQDEVNGYRLGLPIQRNGEMLFYNQTWAQELGFTSPPTTPEEFKAQACAAAKTWLNDPDPNNRGIGGWIINTDPLTILSWMFVFGADRMPDDSNGAYKLNTQANIKALTFLQELFKQGCAWISRFPESDQYFAKRQALFYSASLLDVPLQARVMENAKNKDEWLALPYPHEAGIPVLVVSGSSLAILQGTAEEQMAAWLFTRWLLNPERLARMDAVSGSFPVRISSLDYLSAFRQQYPQWSQAFSWLPWAQPAPRLPSWRAVRWVLSDAAWNVFNPNILPTPIPTILEQADATIIEILNHP